MLGPALTAVAVIMQDAVSVATGSVVPRSVLSHLYPIEGRLLPTPLTAPQKTHFSLNCSLLLLDAVLVAMGGRFSQ